MAADMHPACMPPQQVDLGTGCNSTQLAFATILQPATVLAVWQRPKWRLPDTPLCSQTQPVCLCTRCLPQMLSGTCHAPCKAPHKHIHAMAGALHGIYLPHGLLGRALHKRHHTNTCCGSLLQLAPAATPSRTVQQCVTGRLHMQGQHPLPFHFHITDHTNRWAWVLAGVGWLRRQILYCWQTWNSLPHGLP